MGDRGRQLARRRDAGGVCKLQLRLSQMGLTAAQPPGVHAAGAGDPVPLAVSGRRKLAADIVDGPRIVGPFVVADGGRDAGDASDQQRAAAARSLQRSQRHVLELIPPAFSRAPAPLTKRQ